MPDRATVERLLVAVVEAEQVAAGLVIEAESIEDRTRLLERQRDELAADAPVLDATALRDARAARARTWEAVRAALGSGVAAPAAAALAAEHERAADAADEIADARLQRAEDVARLADVERELAVLAHDIEELGHRRERHDSVLERAAAAWSSAWAPVGALAPAPAEAGAWLATRDAVLAHLADAASAAERAETAETLRAQHTSALCTALGADAAARTDGLPLSALIELADARLDALRGDAEQAGRAAEAIARTVAEREDAEAGLARAEAALARWQDEWSALRAGCGLAEALEPDGALGALRAIEQATRDQERLDLLTADIDAIDARRHAFEAAITELVTATAATDLAEQPVTAAAAVLHRRATEARAAAAEREALAAELAELETEQAEAEAIAAEAEQELTALRTAAGAPDDVALALREDASVRAVELRAEIAQLDGDLARAGGAPAAEVAEAVAALDADALPARVEELEALAMVRRSERDDAGKALTRARDELARLERSEEAAEAAQAKASLEAQIQEHAERYARARLAQRVLRDAIARYRSAHEGPLLARANALFPALTCERYARLETDIDERDEDVLIAVTADGSRRRVPELSDGTREQLFLALRLAAIERHVATAEAVPVLFDDVLLESDDQRAQRILAALAELATQTQVLVLTHHRHLVEIARATLPKRRLDVIELSETAATGPVAPVTTPAPVPTLADELEAALAMVGPPTPPDDFGEQQTLL